MQVRLRVEAVGLNHLDIWVRKGVSGHRFPLPMTPGSDISGVIEELGPGSEFTLGSPVLVNPGVSCGRCEACLGGFDPLCRGYGIFGETQDGGCADFINVPVQNLIARPASISAIQAAALPISFVTAWSMLFRKARIRSGDLVLIQAGGSGVSIAAIQIAKMVGATVITTVGSDAKIERARALGADFVIQYRRQSFREEMKKIFAAAGKKGCDIVLDHVGKDTFADSIKALTWGGKLVICGATSGSEVSIDLKTLFFKNIEILGSTMGSKSDLLAIVQLVASGKLRPVIDSTFEMIAIADAHAKLESREVFGKIVLTN